MSINNELEHIKTRALIYTIALCGDFDKAHGDRLLSDFLHEYFYKYIDRILENDEEEVTYKIFCCMLWVYESGRDIPEWLPEHEKKLDRKLRPEYYNDKQNTPSF